MASQWHCSARTWLLGTMGMLLACGMLKNAHAQGKPLQVGQRVRIAVIEAQVRDGQKVVARVAQGEEFAVIALAGDNVGIKVQGRTGWIARQDVQPVTEAQPLKLSSAQAEALQRAQALNAQIAKMHAQGQYRQAQQLAEQSLAIYKEVRGEKHPETATLISHIGVLLSSQGDFAAARRYHDRALAIRKEVFGEKHESTAHSLNSLGALLRDQGDYSRAQPLLEQALAIRKLVLGDKHPQVADSFSNLGALSSAQGEYTAARRYHEQALSINKAALGEKHSATSASLSCLGVLHLGLGDYAAARPYFEKDLAIKKETLGEKHPSVAIALHNFAVLLQKEGNFSAAQTHYEQALAIRKEVLGEAHYHTATSLNALGTLLEAQGNFEMAQTYYEQALVIQNEVLGNNHPETAVTLSNLGLMLALSGMAEGASQRMELSRRAVRRHVDRVLPGLSEAEQLHFLQTTDAGAFYGALSLGLQHTSQVGMAEASAGWLINGKALAHEALAQRARRARETPDVALAQLLEQLDRARGELARLTTEGPGKDLSRYRERLAQLEAQEQTVSRKLGQAMDHVVRDDIWVEPERVRQALPDGSVLIEIARFDVYVLQLLGRTTRWRAPRYAAWLIPPAGQGEVQLVDLGEAALIEGVVAAFQKEIQSAGQQIGEEGEKDAESLLRKHLDRLAGLVLAPLLPRIGQTPRWLISADAALWLVPWGALPLDNGQYALEQHSISFLTSSRDLVAPASKLRPTANSLVVADPDFNLAPASQATSSSDTRGDSRISRSRVSADWSRLAGTAQEAQALVPHLTQYLKSSPQVFLGSKAVEGVVKGAQRPRVAVLSTHGFFLEDQELNKEKEGREGLIGAQNAMRATQLENPLLRCGLVFSGANQRGKLAAGADDGILTGLEIVGSDLRGTELVVLSACETGLGQVNNGEGVAGLRQAFQLAGAESVISTLWKIPDQETAALMTVFWQELAKGTNKADALRNAQLSVIRAHRAKDQAAHPFFWAAFTLTGQTRFSTSQVIADSVLKVNPKSDPAPVRHGSPAGTLQFRAAAVLQNRELYSLAIDEWKQFLEKFPQDPQIEAAHLYLGTCYMQCRKFKEAGELFQAIVERYPQFEKLEEAFFQLGITHYSLGREGNARSLDAAVTTFTNLIAKNPEGPYASQAMYYRAESLYARGTKAEAAQAYVQFIGERKHEQHALLPDALYALGVTQEELAQRSEAAKAFDHFLQKFDKHPLSPEVEFRRAELFLVANKYAEAAALFAKASNRKGFALADHALFRQAVSVQQDRKYAAAAALFDALPVRFPQSKYLAPAKLEADKCRELLGK